MEAEAPRRRGRPAEKNPLVVPIGFRLTRSAAEALERKRDTLGADADASLSDLARLLLLRTLKIKQ